MMKNAEELIERINKAIEIIAKQNTNEKVKIHKLERIYTYINRIYRNQ